MKVNEAQHQIRKIYRKGMELMSGILAVTALALIMGAGSAQARPLGIDVSRWQGTINWTSVKGAGISFAWAQATRGLTSPNANFVANMNNGKAAGVYMGAYHYAFPNDSTPEVQADYYWNLAGPYIKGDGKSLVPALDMEVWVGYQGATSYTDWANKWIARVKSKAAAVGVTIPKVVIYTSASMACHFNSGISQHGAWIANWNGQNPQTGTPWSCCSSCNKWGTWHFWQYTDSGSVSGISGAVDRNTYNGTLSGLEANWLCTGSTGGGGGVTVDNSNAGFSVTGTWNTGTSATDKFGADYRFHNTQSVSEPATWTANLGSTKTYSVSAWWSQGANRSSTAPYVVYHSSGSTTVSKNQQSNGGSWQLLGSWNMNAGSNQVRLSCWTTTGFVVIADAVKWE